MVKPKIVLLIFVSGKIVLTGAKVRLFAFLPLLDLVWEFLVGANGVNFWDAQVREEIYQAFESIYPVLTEFRKNS